MRTFLHRVLCRSLTVAAPLGAAAGNPTGPRPLGSGKLRRLRAALADFPKLLWTLLRELADENAYARHLAHHGVEHSKEEWRRFSTGRLSAKYARARCC